MLLLVTTRHLPRLNERIENLNKDLKQIENDLRVLRLFYGIQSILINMDSDGQMVNGDISIFGGFIHIYMQRHAFKM